MSYDKMMFTELYIYIYLFTHIIKNTDYIWIGTGRRECKVRNEIQMDLCQLTTHIEPYRNIDLCYLTKRIEQ